MLRIATCALLPEPDADEGPLLAALARRGVPARLAAWDASGEDWDEPHPTVIRSTWNYIHALDAFRRWVDRAAAAGPLWNPAAVVRENLHKSYLARLAGAGHGVVPTVFLARGDRGDIRSIRAKRRLDRVVIKPTVSAGSFGTSLFGPGEDDAAQEHLDRLLAERDAMVQEYLPSVEDHGERSLVWIDGEFTHAMRKSPRFSTDAESVTGPFEIVPDERALAEAVLGPIAAAHDLLYGRVDLARDAAGRPVLMELELVEPSLFLAQYPPALERLCEALVRRSSSFARVRPSVPEGDRPRWSDPT